MKHFQRSLYLFLIFSFPLSSVFAYQITSLTASYQSGQVFLTWTNPLATNLKYRVYRSTSKITSSTQLGSGTYLGYVMDNSAKNIRKSNLKNSTIYFTINPSSGPLASTQGLYVVTCTDNQTWYYAVTVEDLSTHVEELAVTLGSNSLSNGVQESVAAIQPVLQSTVNDNSGDVDYEYVVWGNNQSTSNLPAFNNAGSYGYNFTFIYHTSGSVPLYIMFRDNDPFSHFNPPTECGNCNSLVMDDWLPNGESTYWFGYDDGFDIYSPLGTSVFTTGTVRSYTQARVKWTINWVVSAKQLDATRVYCSGTSHNGFGALLTGIINPEMIAAEWGTVPPPVVKALAGSDWEKILCAYAANLPTDVNDPNTGLPLNIWDLFDFREMYRINNQRGIPYIGAVNGKKDVTIGWVESLNWYDSLNVSHQGGVWFWDQRKHNGVGRNFTDAEATINYSRFSTTKSYPGFAYCSINQNPGGSDPTTGDPYGAINGYLDWDDNSIIDQACSYSILCRIKDMYVNGVLQQQYDSCTSDVTFRRVQNFHPTVGQTLTWTNYGPGNQLLQSGSFVYDGKPITLTAVKIKRSGSTITLKVGTSQLTTYYSDADADGYGSGSVSVQACIPPVGYVTNNTDCNDANAAIHPGVTEVCNGIDDNCSGQIDEGVTTTFYVDADGDTYGNSNVSTQACSAPSGYVLNGTDCDDANPSVHPNVIEVINGIDDNCNGLIDDLILITFYADADGDGFGNPNITTQAYALPSGYVLDATDCDDGNSAVHPGATETCNGIDDNCSGQIDEGVKTTFFADADGDGYGNPNATTQACSAPIGYLTDNTDCNDANASVHPGVTEICNNVDDNCSGQIDEGVKTTFYADADGDGYGNINVTTQACSPPVGYVTNNTDCDDTKANVKPGATETCNGIDDNCNGQIDDGVVSAAISPAGTVNICSGNNVALQANTGSGLTYQWKKNGLNISGATTSGYTASVAAVYTVVVSKSSCSATSDGTTLNVISLSAPVITTSSGVSVFCSNSGVYLTTSITGYSYSWYKGTTLQPGATSQNYTPGSSGTYKVMITDAYGCTKNSAGLAVTVNTAPSPAITGGSVICQGQSTILSASNTNYTGYLWSTGATNPSINVTAAGSYSVTVTDVNSCTGISAPQVMTVNPLPTPTISASGATEFCDGGSVILSVAQTYPSYSWSNNKFTQTQTITTSGNYYCTVTDANGCQGTSNSITVNEHVLPTPTVATSTGATAFCSNSGVYLTTSSSGYNYSWYKGSNIQSGATNQNYIPSSSGTYKVQISDAFGCTSNSGTISITVNTAPSPTITGGTSICQGKSTTLSANTTYSHYSWSTGATSQSINISTAGTYSLTVTDANGCTGTAPSVTTVVYSNPTATITPSGATEFCSGSNVTLTASSATSYSWSNGKATQAITVTTTGTYSVTVTDVHGCTAVSAPTTVNVHTLPIPSVTAVGATTYCVGSPDSYLTTSTTGYSYQWKKGTSLMAGATNQNYQPVSNGTYKVQISDNFGCTKLSSNGIKVTANPSPTVSISASGNLNLCNGDTKVISATASGNGIKYQWQKNAVDISGATASSYTASVAGSYTCRVTNSSLCTATSNSIVITANCKLNDGESAGDEEQSLVKLYPNPAFNDIHVDAQFASHSIGEVFVEIRNVLGEVVYTDKQQTQDGKFSGAITFDQRFSNGSYFLRICLNEDCIVRQFLITASGQ